MKINISKERVVYQGPAYEDSFWGQVQFPEIFKCEDGSLAIKTHDADDNWAEFGRNKDVWCVSKDNGETWSVPSPNKFFSSPLSPKSSTLYYPSLLSCYSSTN